jgi:hypothetical protein|tara:strand:+ start:1728 stop:2324 length:597 start_codon:yes stop_codon:yes gene_type:complete
MNGYQAYQIYQSLKLHFTRPSYNAVKYNFRTSIRQSTFENRRDRYFFEKLSRRYDQEELIHYFTANFICDSNVWIGNMSDDIYRDYVSRHDKLTYTFTQDMKTMANHGHTLEGICTTIDNGSNNPLLEALRADEIQSESVILLDLLVRFLKRLRTDLCDPLGINVDLIDTLQKYGLIMQRRMLPLDKAKSAAILTFKN